MRYIKHSRDVVESVYDIIQNLRNDLPWTITIAPARSGGFYVSTVIDASLAGIRPFPFLNKPQSISDKAPDYTFPPGKKDADAGLE